MKTLYCFLLLSVATLSVSAQSNTDVITYFGESGLLTTREKPIKITPEGDTLEYITRQAPCPEGRVGCLVYHTKSEWVEKHPRPKATDPMILTRGQYESLLERIHQLEKEVTRPKPKPAKVDSQMLDPRFVRLVEAVSH